MHNNNTFSFPEATILLLSTKNHDLWPGPDLLNMRKVFISYPQPIKFADLMASPRIVDFWCWTCPEVVILGANQKDQ